jgi:hypothetical protein
MRERQLAAPRSPSFCALARWLRAIADRNQIERTRELRAELKVVGSNLKRAVSRCGAVTTQAPVV